MNNFEKLETLSIFELRDLARKVGVYSPTLLRKSELIIQIQDIMTGKKSPFTPKTKQGRPAKNISGYENIVNVFLPDNVNTLQTDEEKTFTNQLTKFNDTVFAQESESFEYSTSTVKHGYVELLANKNALIRPNVYNNSRASDLVFVVIQTVENYNLKSGDEIICNARYVSEDKPMILTSVLSINGIPIEKWCKDREDFDQMPHIPTKEHFGINKDLEKMFNISNEFAYGSNIVLYTNQNSTQYLNVLINGIDTASPIIFLNPSITGKNIDTIKTMSKVLPFCADFVESFASQQKICFLALNRAKRLAEQGKDVLLVVDDAMTLANLNSESTNEIYVVKSVISAAKNTKNGSITVLTTLSEPNTPLHSVTYNTITRLQDVSITPKN